MAESCVLVSMFLSLISWVFDNDLVSCWNNLHAMLHLAASVALHAYWSAFEPSVLGLHIHPW